MKSINITEEQRNKLCSELARLTFEFRKDKSVKCVYFAPYIGLGNIAGNVLEVTLVKDGSENDDLDKKLKEYNLSHIKHDFIREFGCTIFLDIDDARKYTTLDLNPSECRRSNHLMNSLILYDVNGEFTKIKEQTVNAVKNNGKGITEIYYYYDNLAEIFPSLDETLYKALEVTCMQKDTEACKEFFELKLSPSFKNM